MKLFSLFIFLASSQIYAADCIIELYPKIYKVEGTSIQAKDYIKHKTCSESVLFKLNSFFQNIEGDIHSSMIKEELLTINNAVAISPARISIKTVGSVLKERLFPDNDNKFISLKSLENKTALALEDNEALNVICSSCNNLGDKNIQIVISSALGNAQKNNWFYGKLVTSISALKALTNINFQQEKLQVSDFSLEKFYTDRPEDYITDLNSIIFYKPNRIILKDSYLNRMDILALNLINYGSPVKGIYNFNGLTIEKNFMPTRSAKLNETIELNGENNKKLYGKVVGFNKVEIEL